MDSFYQDEAGKYRKLTIIGGVLLLALLGVIYFLYGKSRNSQQQYKVSEMEHLQLNDEFSSVFRDISGVLKLDQDLLAAQSAAGRSELMQTKAVLEKQINDGVVSIKAAGTRKIPQSVRSNRDNYIKLVEAIMASRSNMELLWGSVDAASKNDMLVSRLNIENRQLKAEIGRLKSVAAQEGSGNSSSNTALQASLQQTRDELQKCRDNLAKAGKTGSSAAATTDEGKKAVLLFDTVEELVAKASRESSLTMQRSYLRVSKEILDGIRPSFPDRPGLEKKQTEIDNMLKNIGRY